MYDVNRVEVIYSLYYLLEHTSGRNLPTHAVRLLSHILLHRDAFDVVCEKVHLSRGINQVVQTDDTRMLKPFQHSNLSLHGLTFHRVRQSIFFVRLYRILDLVALVQTDAHLRVRALPNNPADLVVLQGTAAVDIGGLGALHLLALRKAEFSSSLRLRRPVEEVRRGCGHRGRWRAAVPGSAGGDAALLGSAPVVGLVEEGDAVFFVLLFQGVELVMLRLAAHGGGSCGTHILEAVGILAYGGHLNHLLVSCGGYGTRRCSISRHHAIHTSIVDV